MTESLAAALRCIDCASEVALGDRLPCPSCDGLLELIRIRIGDRSYEEIQERLSALPAGSLVRLTALRDGQQVELSAPR